MNKFIDNIYYLNTNHYRPEITPMMNGFTTQESFEYSPKSHQTLYHFMVQFKADAWVSGDESSSQYALKEIRNIVRKRLHFELYGEIESYLHELQLHVYNLDFDSAKKTISIIQDAIKFNPQD